MSKPAHIKPAKVGYKNPPQEHRFSKGRSGNPFGRKPKQDKGPTDLLEEQLQEKVEVTVNGRKRKVSKKELLIMQIVNNGLKGQPTALRALVQFFPELDARHIMQSFRLRE